MAQAKLPRAPARTAADYRAEIVALLEAERPAEATALARKATQQFPDDEHLNRLATTLSPPPPQWARERPKGLTRDFDAEQRFAARIAGKYAGKIVAIHGERVLASGTKVRTVVAKARKRDPVAVPWLVHFPER